MISVRDIHYLVMACTWLEKEQIKYSIDGHHLVFSLPVCSEKLQTLTISEIDIDVCPYNKGINIQACITLPAAYIRDENRDNMSAAILRSEERPDQGCLFFDEERNCILYTIPADLSHARKDSINEIIADCLQAACQQLTNCVIQFSDSIVESTKTDDCDQQIRIQQELSRVFDELFGPLTDEDEQCSPCQTDYLDITALVNEKGEITANIRPEKKGSEEEEQQKPLLVELDNLLYKDHECAQRKALPESPLLKQLDALLNE